MAERPDYYAVLGVERDATSVAIRAAYRRLVLSHHPDRHPGDPDATTRLKHLVEAYEALGEASRRSAYDAGVVVTPPVQRGEPWEEILGRVVDAVVGPRDARSVAGRDHEYRLTITAQQAARGCQSSLELPWLVDCEACEGRGFPLEVFPTVCTRCHGAGSLEQRRALRRVLESCDACHGRGYLVSQPCEACGGRRSQEVRRPIVIDVPAGVATGERLLVKGGGQRGAGGGEDGDCFVVVTVEPHPALTVVGRDVTLCRPVPVFEAIAGGWITVPTFDGPRRLRLPANTLAGTVLRMPGLGVGAEEDARGDQLVTLDIEYPEALDEASREQLEALGAGLGPEAFPRTTRFLRDVVSVSETPSEDSERE
ncbi:MAG: J domain-containing protein [Myxococcota bacterium]|nr:J domain-containing protein [Myxococcota bacterium]